MGDNYFCRSTTTSLAGRRPVLTGMSEDRGSMRSDGYGCPGQVAEAEADGWKEEGQLKDWIQRTIRFVGKLPARL